MMIAHQVYVVITEHVRMVSSLTAAHVCKVLLEIIVKQVRYALKWWLARLILLLIFFKE